MTIKEIARTYLEAAQDGIAWIALWKKGRRWGAETFWPDYDERTDRVSFQSMEEIETAVEILKDHPDAILVNSYVHNLGGIGDDLTAGQLADGLAWQYKLQHSMLKDAFV